MNRGSKGFTIVEALASVVLIGVGVTAALGGLSSIAKAEGDGRDRERLELLASQKLDELLATGNTANATSGDFTDHGQADVDWDSQVTPSGVDNLNRFTVTVRRRNDAKSPVAELDTLIYVPPTTTTESQ